MIMHQNLREKGIIIFQIQKNDVYQKSENFNIFKFYIEFIHLKIFQIIFINQIYENQVKIDNMKKQHFPKVNTYFNSIKNNLNQFMDQEIKVSFDLIRNKEHSYKNIEKFYELLESRKRVNSLPAPLKREIYKYFLEKELQTLNFIKIHDQYSLKILKMTKIKLTDFKLNWKDIIGKFQKSFQTTQKLSGLYEFLGHLREYYEENNIMDVFEYFKGKYNFANEMTWLYMEKFFNLNKNTDPRLLKVYTDKMYDFHVFEKLKQIYLWRWILKITKKCPNVDLNWYIELLNKNMIKYLVGFQNKSKGILQSMSYKFLADALGNMIGKQNPKTDQLIQAYFTIFKHSLVAFQESKTPIKFLSGFLEVVYKRQKKQIKLHQQVQKILKQQTIQETKQEEDQQQKEEQKQGADTGNMVGNFVVLIQSDQEEDQTEELKGQQKLNQLKVKLLNEIQETTLQKIKQLVLIYLENIFFIQSSESSKLLKYIYSLFPQLVEGSIKFLIKGIQITELNFAYLMKNTKKIIQYLFLQKTQQKSILENVLTILQNCLKVRYIKDAWNCFYYIFWKIPLLDEQDLVSNQTKQAFQTKFGMPHDKFYQRYSEIAFQAFKRFLKESQARQKKKYNISTNPFYSICSNSYPQFSKRCLTYAIEAYLDTPSYFIHNYFILHKIPQNLLNNFIPDIDLYQNQQLQLKVQQLLIAAKSMKFKQMKSYFNKIAQHPNQNLLNQGLSMLSTYITQQINLKTIVNPIKSTLNYLDSVEKQQIKLKNKNKKQIQIKITQLLELWNQNYQFFNKFIKENNPQDKYQDLDILNFIMNFHFTTQPINFNIRKEFVWRIETMLFIMQQFPTDKRCIPESDTSVNIQYTTYQCLSQLVEKSKLMLQKIFYIVFKKFSHDEKLLGVLRKFGYVLMNLHTTSQMFHYQSKQIRKNNKISQPEGYINYFQYQYQIDSKIIFSNYAIKYKTNDNLELIEKYLSCLLFLPIQITTQSLSFDVKNQLIQNVITLLQHKIPQTVDLNKKKIFLTRLSKIISSEINKINLDLTIEQLIILLELCIDHIGSTQRTIRESFLLAIKQLLSRLQDNTCLNSELLEQKIIKGVGSQNSKKKLIWSIVLIICQIKDKKINLGKIYKYLENLLFDEDYLIRKFGLFVNSFIIRKQKTTQKNLNLYKDLGQYQQKSLLQFFKTGFLRSQQCQLDIVKKKYIKKYCGYDSYQISQKPIFLHTFEFIFDSKKCLNFIKQYHTDQISSEQEISLNKKVAIKDITELGDIFMWLVNKLARATKLSKHHYSIYQRIYGEKFFKYLFFADSQMGFNFFESTKDFIKSCLAKIQTLDNQYVVAVYITNLLYTYSRLWRTERNKSIEQFIEYVLTQILEKSSGVYYNQFIKLCLFIIQPIDFICEFLNKYPYSNLSYYRIIQIKLHFYADDYEKLYEILVQIFREKKGLQNPTVLKLLKILINFNQKHYLNVQQIQKYKILNVQKLKQQNKILKQTEYIYTANRNQFDSFLIKNIKDLLSQDTIQRRKLGSNILFQCLNYYSNLRKSKANIQALNNLLKVGTQWIIMHKEEFKNQQNNIQTNLNNVLSHLYEQQQFSLIIQNIIEILVPNLQAGQYIQLMHKNPFNYYFLKQQSYLNVIKKILSLLGNNILYRQVLTTLSTLFYYRNLKFQKNQDKIKSIKSIVQNQKHVVIILQAIMLTNARFIEQNEQYLNYILNSKQKDGIKQWAKRMVEARGKGELIQQQNARNLWKKIKSFSNPYFYHA